MLMAAATHYLGGSAHSSSSSSSSISPPPPWHPVLLVPSHQHQAVVYDLEDRLVTPPSPSPSTTPQHLRPTARRAGKPRRPRPSRKLPTTYISADAASFRRMVHQVTGADVDAAHQQATELLCRPAPPSRAVLSTTTTTLVPTLDTSALLLGAGGGGRPGAACFRGSAGAVGDPGASLQAAEEACGGGGVGGGGGEYSCSNGVGGGFPSLESWDDDALF